MRQNSSTVQSINRAGGQAKAEADEQYALMRGLVHGVVLSMVVWTGILYLSFGLR